MQIKHHGFIIYLNKGQIIYYRMDIHIAARTLLYWREEKK